MKLLTASIRAQLPALYAQEHCADAIAYVKFFMPSLKASRTFGYCSGFGWVRGEWRYFIELENDTIAATKQEILATGRMEANTVRKPAYAVGDRVMLVSNPPTTKQRLVLGIQVADQAWYYLVEWRSPMLVPTSIICDGVPPSVADRFSMVREEDLVRVMV